MTESKSAAEFGISDEGYLAHPLRRLDNGFIVPDVDLKALHEYHQQEVRNQLEVGIQGEAFGFDFVVHPEHHFYALGAGSTNPLMMQTAIATRTDEIRLLQMANILPWHEPVRLAEQTAMLDVLSDGRAEVGVGIGYGRVEAAILGQHWGGSMDDFDRQERTFEEKFEILKQCWTDDLVSYEGEFHEVPPAGTEWSSNSEYHYFDSDATEAEPTDYFSFDGDEPTLRSTPVHPQPISEPHPQLWEPAMSPESFERAARAGRNCCCHCNEFSNVRERIDAYHEAAADAGWPDHRPSMDGEPFRRGWDARRRRGVATILSVFNTDLVDEAGYERAKLALAYGLCGSDQPLPPEDDDQIEIDVDEKLASVDAPIFGDSDHVLDRLARFVDVSGYDDVLMVVNMQKRGLTHEDHLEQLHWFADEVIPYFEQRSATIHQ